MIDFQLGFNIDTVSIEMTGNKSDQLGNSKLMSFGFAKQSMIISKSGQVFKLNCFGMTLGTFNKIEELYKFLLRTKTTVMSVGESVTSQIKNEDYMVTLKEAIDHARDFDNRSEGAKSDYSNDL